MELLAKIEDCEFYELKSVSDARQTFFEFDKNPAKRFFRDHCPGFIIRWLYLKNLDDSSKDLQVMISEVGNWVAYDKFGNEYHEEEERSADALLAIVPKETIDFINLKSKEVKANSRFFKFEDFGRLEICFVDEERSLILKSNSFYGIDEGSAFVYDKSSGECSYVHKSGWNTVVNDHDEVTYIEEKFPVEVAMDLIKKIEAIPLNENLKDARSVFIGNNLIPKDVFEQLKAGDPSSSWKYIYKMCQLYCSRRKPEAIIDLIQRYDKVLLYIEDKDITNKNWIDISRDVEVGEERKSKSKKSQILDMETKSLVYETPKLKLYRITSYEDSRLFGVGTRWCISTSNKTYFDEYVSRGHKFLMIKDKRHCFGDALSVVCIDIDVNEKTWALFDFDNINYTEEGDEYGNCKISEILKTYPKDFLEVLKSTIDEIMLDKS